MKSSTQSCRNITKNNTNYTFSFSFFSKILKFKQKNTEFNRTDYKKHIFYGRKKSPYDKSAVQQMKKGGRRLINNVILVGRLTKDPELKYLSDGTAVTLFNLAVNRNFRSQSGEVETDFVSIRLWNKLAENTANYCRKGSLVGITGRIQTRRYEDSKGATVYVTEVIGDAIRFLDRRKRTEGKREETKQETKQEVIHV